jgi:hypothetical protein
MLLLHELDPEIQGMSSHPLNSGLSNLVERPPFPKGALFGNRKAWARVLLFKADNIRIS